MEHDFWLLIAMVLAVVSGVVYAIERALAPALLAFAVASLSVYFLAL